MKKTNLLNSLLCFLLTTVLSCKSSYEAKTEMYKNKDGILYISVNYLHIAQGINLNTFNAELKPGKLKREIQEIDCDTSETIEVEFLDKRKVSVATYKYCNPFVQKNEVFSPDGTASSSQSKTFSAQKMYRYIWKPAYYYVNVYSIKSNTKTKIFTEHKLF